MSIASFCPRLRISRRPARRRKPAHLALTVARRASDLDRRLAAGEDPWGSDELALRARTLTTARSRMRLANGLAGVSRSAGNDAPRFTAAVRPSAPDVLEAQSSIASIERRLRAPGPVPAQGVAIIRLLLIDGNGPLYRPGDPQALRSHLRAAAAALGNPEGAR
jgi:hypothetical protein